MTLGDLGADVIKVERPGIGDDTRGWGPPFDDRGQSAYFLSVNRNKLSIAADLTQPADREFIASLLRDADVVVENFLPEARERLGLDVEAALAQRPRLVWCSIFGFDAESPRPGYDFVVQAEAGWMSITGERDGDPMKAGVAIADLLAGRDAAIAILAALLGRAAGAERHIRISLMDSARASLVNVAQNALVSGGDAQRWGNAHANLVPYQLFRARDRHVVIAVGSDAQWVACAEALGLADLAADNNLATNAGRLAQRQRVTSAIARVVSKRTAAQWIARLDDAGVPCGIVKTVLEAVRETAATPVAGMPSPIGGTVRFVPPRLDEHAGLIRRHGWEAFRAVTTDAPPSS